MEISLPADCGNAPRLSIVSEFVVNWAQSNTDAIAEWLSEDVRWVVVGEGNYVGLRAAQKTTPSIHVERLTLLSVLSHGRLASCDGYLETDNTRIYFSHVFRFASTAKTAKIVELRTYIINMETKV